MLYYRLQRWIMNVVMFLSSCELYTCLGAEDTWGFIPTDPKQSEVIGNKIYAIPEANPHSLEKRGWEALDFGKRSISTIPIVDVKRGWEGLNLKRGMAIDKNSIYESKRGWEGRHFRYKWLNPRRYRPQRKRTENGFTQDLQPGQNMETDPCNCCNDSVSASSLCCTLCTQTTSGKVATSVNKVNIKTSLCQCCALFNSDVCCYFCRNLDK